MDCSNKGFQVVATYCFLRLCSGTLCAISHTNATILYRIQLKGSIGTISCLFRPEVSFGHSSSPLPTRVTKVTTQTRQILGGLPHRYQEGSVVFLLTLVATPKLARASQALLILWESMDERRLNRLLRDRKLVLPVTHKGHSGCLYRKFLI